MGTPYAEVIGDPVAHSKSPAIHRFWLEKLGMEGDYRATRVGRDELASFLAARRSDPDWRGCNLTLPHKTAILPFLDDRFDSNVGAVNCVVPRSGGLIGHNTDIDGVDCAVADGVDTDVPVCIVGAGGAARAAIASLDIPAVYQFNVIVRTPAKGEALLKEFGMDGRAFEFSGAAEAIRGCAGLVNATPLGMTGFDPMPRPILSAVATLRRRAFVLDMVYAPAVTELVRHARVARLRVSDGLTMLVGQAKSAFELFFGAEPPSACDAELRALLMR